MKSRALKKSRKLKRRRQKTGQLQRRDQQWRPSLIPSLHQRALASCVKVPQPKLVAARAMKLHRRPRVRAMRRLRLIVEPPTRRTTARAATARERAPRPVRPTSRKSRGETNACPNHLTSPGVFLILTKTLFLKTISRVIYKYCVLIVQLH